MQTLIHADIFFFVTTIAVVLVAIILVVVLVFLAVIMAEIAKLARTVRREGEEIAADVHDIRAEIKEEMRYEARSGASPAAAFLNFVATLYAHKRSKRHHHKE